MDSADRLYANSEPRPSIWRFFPLNPSRMALAILVGAVTSAVIVVDRGRILQLTLILPLMATFLLSGRALEKSLMLALAVACLLPQESVRQVIKPEEALPLLALALLLGQQRASSAPRRRLKLTWTEIWILVLIAAAAFGALHGIATGMPGGHALDEFALLLDFAVAAIVIRAGLSEKGIKQIILTLVIAAVIVSLRYLAIFITGGGRVRAASDQQHLLNVAFPLVIAFAMTARNWRERAVALLLAAPMLPAIYVTQTRAIWIYVPFSVFLLIALYVRHGFLRLRSRSIVGILIAATVLTAVAAFILYRGGSIGQQTMAARNKTLGTLSSDLSLASRVDLGFQALGRAISSPLWGRGLGDHLRYRIINVREDLYFMDFSYMWAFWKLGLIGLIPLIGLYLVFMKRVWAVYRRSADPFQRRVAAGVFVSFVALLMIGFESGILVIYRFNLVWAILMGIFEHWYQGIASEWRPDVPVRI